MDAPELKNKLIADLDQHWAETIHWLVEMPKSRKRKLFALMQFPADEVMRDIADEDFESVLKLACVALGEAFSRAWDRMQDES